MVSVVPCVGKGCVTSTAAYMILDLIPVAAAVSPSYSLYHVVHRQQVEPVEHLYENIVSWSVGITGISDGRCQHCVDL